MAEAPRRIATLPDVMSLAKSEAANRYVGASPTMEEGLHLMERFATVDLNPKKGPAQRHMISQNGGSTTYLVQEDMLVIAELRDDESLAAQMTSCTGIVFRGERNGRAVIGFAHIDPLEGRNMVAAKANRLVKALKAANVTVEEAYVDSDPDYQSENNALIGGRIRGLDSIARPAKTDERILVASSDGIGLLSKTKTGDVADKLRWKTLS